MSHSRLPRRLAAAAVIAGFTTAAAPAVAGATPLLSVSLGNSVSFTVEPSLSSLLATANCSTNYADSQAFLPWNDGNEYRLVPGGSFATGDSGWTLSGGASASTSGGNPTALAGAVSGGALTLTRGATATSPYSCVDTSQPTVRMMARAVTPGATVTVSATYLEPTGELQVPIGQLTPSGTWQPSPVIYNDQVVGGLLTGGAVPMSLDFSASGGTVAIDDAFVDPRMH